MSSIYFPGAWNIQLHVGGWHGTKYAGDDTQEALRIWNELRAKYRHHDKGCYLELRQHNSLKFTMLNKKLQASWTTISKMPNHLPM